jgi:hypothetical protein
MQVLFSTHPTDDWQHTLAELALRPRSEPFSADALSFVEAFSGSLRKHPGSRIHPELAALAYWFRPTAARQLRSVFMDRSRGRCMHPRGLVFHLAPSNVDILFAYGWLLSILSGNSNVARLSQKVTQPREVLLQILAEMASSGAYRRVLQDSLLVSYPHDDALTTLLSRACDVRLIWGGDATVEHIRQIPLKPTAVELAFADRYSLAALKTSAVLTMSAEQLNKLAERLANDIFMFNQQACSSPRSIVWIGGAEDEIGSARTNFWAALERAARRFANPPHALITRITNAFLLAAGGGLSDISCPLASFPLRGFGNRMIELERRLHNGNGFLTEYALDSLAQLAGHVCGRDQTLVVFGFTSEELVALMPFLPNRAVDRIVVPGEALSFDTVWDGMDLFAVLTREIRIHKPRQL